MKNTKLCEHNKECSIYKGTEVVNDMPVWVYKNVFCTRGERGWLNCKRYLELKKKENE